MEDKQTDQNNDSELEELKKQAEEYLNNWKRERADLINYKKDEARRMEEFLKFSTEGIITELIDVIDGIEVSRKNLPDSKEFKEWTNGFDSSLDKLNKFLKKFGVEKIEVEGQKFDPNYHEVVAMGEAGATSEERASRARSEGGERSEVPSELQEIRPGYTMHGKVIRPARVKIIN